MEEISEKIMGMISNVDACQNSISPHTYFIKSLKIEFCENFFCQWQKKASFFQHNAHITESYTG